MTALTDRPADPSAATPLPGPGTCAPELRDAVIPFLREATDGPEKSGLNGTLTVDGVSLDVSASRGWGLQVCRTLPDGRLERRHLRGDELTLERTIAVCLELSRAA